MLSCIIPARRAVRVTALSAIALGASLAAAAQAQDARPTVPGDVASGTDEELLGDDVHDRRVDASGTIIVTAARSLREFDLLAGTSVLEGDQLQRNLSPQLGDTLSKIPGVSATSFAPGASRPVLRGFSGERVRVLVDGIGAIDASNTSDDHAVAIDPLTTERIEVLRGPAVLLYGSQAIGGAVNVVDKRIPRRIPDEVVHIDGLASYDTVNEQIYTGGSIDLPLGRSGFVAHVDGSYRKSNDLRVPGFTVAPELRADLVADAAEEIAQGNPDEADELLEAAGQRGFVPNTGAEGWSVNGGIAYIVGDSSFGLSVGYYDTDYGVPGRPGTGHHHGEEGDEDEEETEAGAEEGPVTIGMEKLRADFRGDILIGEGFLGRLLTRFGYSDYTHTEFEGDEVGTVFDVAGMEARVEVIQNPVGQLRGSFGAQYYFRDFQAVGGEAFVAPNLTGQFAVFTLQEFGDGPFSVEAAARYERTDVDAPTLGIARDFDAFSGALGVAYQMDDVRLGVNGTRVERAPAGEELFAGGPHIATQAFEIGDPDLVLERAWGLEGYVRGTLGRARFGLAVFHNWFDNYIYLSATGAEEDDLPVFVFLQDEARYFGVEGELSLPFYRTDALTLTAEGGASYVRAGLDDDTPVPRIPPLTLSGALEADFGGIDLRGEVQYFGAQDRTAPFERRTDDFVFVNASAALRPFDGAPNVSLIAAVDNILDVEGRRAASFTKDFVPLAGRNFRASLRFSF